MLRIFHNTTYDFIKPWRIMVVITVAFISIGLVFLGVSKIRTGNAVRYSIDFTGGTSVQVHFKQRTGCGCAAIGARCRRRPRREHPGVRLQP